MVIPIFAPFLASASFLLFHFGLPNELSPSSPLSSHGDRPQEGKDFGARRERGGVDFEAWAIRLTGQKVGKILAEVRSWCWLDRRVVWVLVFDEIAFFFLLFFFLRWIYFLSFLFNLTKVLFQDENENGKMVRIGSGNILRFKGFYFFFLDWIYFSILFEGKNGNDCFEL